MNYTEKYHLPQWEEQDRVMRKDFNRMCSDMEAGLTENARDARTGLALAEDKTFALFCRAAYNHYLYIREMESVPRQIGVFYQGFDKDMSYMTNIGRRNNYGWMTTGETAFTSQEFKRGLNRVSNMTVVKDTPSACVPAVLTFHTTAPGHLSQIGLPGSINHGDGNPIIWRFSLYNVTTGVLESYQDITVGSYQSASGGFLRDIDLYFWGGYDYRLEVSPHTTNYDGTFGFDMERSHVSAACFMYAEGSVTHNFQEAEESRGGVVWVRYNIKKDTAAFWLEWDGQRLEPERIRTVTENGITMKEAEFRDRKSVV